MMSNKFCTGKEMKHEHEIDDLIMLEDSARGTLCAIHKTIHSTDNFPSSRHKMMRLCPVSRNPSIQNHNRGPVKVKKKGRPASPPDRQKMCRTIQRIHSPCASIVSHNIQMTGDNSCNNSDINKINCFNLEKTISCPGKMYHISTTSRQNCNLSSTGSLHIVDKFPCNVPHADSVVDELKGELEKVKHQISRLSTQKFPTRCNTPTTSESRKTSPKSQDHEGAVNKLKNENKKLKRELEAKRRLLERSKCDVERAKDILSDYEKKVSLLHAQAVKSSKTMKLSKEKFCQYLKDRDEKIKYLKESQELLAKNVKQKDSMLKEKDEEISNLNYTLEAMKRAFSETSEKCTCLAETNQSLCESAEVLKSRLMTTSTEIDKHKETIKVLEQKFCELNDACKKINTKARKQKENYDNKLKDFTEEKSKMAEKMSELSTKVDEVDTQKNIIKELECECKNLREKIKSLENMSDRCESLEQECKKHYESLLDSQVSFHKERDEMNKLIDQLTTVVKDNKTTLQHMSEINKQQEDLIKSQSMALLTKEQQLKLIEKQSEQFEIKNKELERELEDLRRNFSAPCSKEACICISKELEKVKSVLNAEKDTKLLKEKIINDQSQTIINLQKQVREKITELNKAHGDMKYLEDEINSINAKLINKHKELDIEIDEKESLIEKLRVLECQRNQLQEEINDFEDMLKEFKTTYGNNEDQANILKNLEQQIEEQKRQWDAQKEEMVREKQKAVCAAKFATQKLLDTVVDFQRQVDAQKKVQVLLTKMLHEKDEQLKAVTSKISNINDITKDVSKTEYPMKQLFFRKLTRDVPSNLNTNASVYSSCSSCCKRSESSSNKYEKTKFDMEDKICLETCDEMNRILNDLSRRAPHEIK
ncbi:putative leucine-rich repeat-containing protein DDB_G0290503 [Sitophilus oryzae]|uniref:Leucine-rich repeat-containing protein DDB_G0290503 n=1 Tax=Sitophilus oryzae TaxID=7048 RepID=A0A6J2YN38_SITOR|nr:putative leucine-rich repeat-containing protein DDB_G0290503 [Sitophilus oryzae]